LVTVPLVTAAPTGTPEDSSVKVTVPAFTVAPLLVTVEEMTQRADVTGIVDQDVDRAEPIQRGIHHAIHISRLTDISRHRQRLPTVAGDLRGGLGGRLAIDIGDHHVGALRGIAMGDRITDPLSTASHDRNLALEHITRCAHVTPSRIPDWSS